MISISPVSININYRGINLSPSVVGIGHLGSSKSAPQSFPFNTLTVPWRDLQDDPSYFSLLSWHTSISEFAGRGNEIEKLESWVKSKQAVSLKFITGDGGVGKSRLAAEFASSLQERKWSAGFVDLRKPQSFPLEQEGTLIIVDYPEESRDAVTELLQDLAYLDKSKRFRIIFLTRQQIGDWYEVIHDGKAADIVDMVPIDLGHSRFDGPAAHTLYHSALEHASEQFDTTPPPLSVEALVDWLGQAPENERALFILGAAVHSALHPEDEVVRYSGREVIEAIVDREIDRLRGIAKDRKAKDPYIFARLLAMASIVNELSIEDISKCAHSSNLKLGFRAGATLESELRAAGLLKEDRVRAPKPDIVAAAFTVKVLSHDVKTAPQLVWASLERNVQKGLTIVARLCHDAEVVLGIHEPRISQWLAMAVRGQQNKCSVLDGFFSEVQPPLPLGWIDASIAVHRTLLEVSDEDEERARLLNNLSVDLYTVGDTAAALAASKDAVEIKRRLVQANPARYEAVLAVNLNNLSAILTETVDHTGALAVSREAVEISRRLAKTNPALYEPELTGSLHNLSIVLSNTSDHTGALEAIQEAVEIRRRLAKANPARYEPDLASSLNNLSSRLIDVGDTADALATIQEAVEINRRLVQANPARYEPDLASSLNNVSNRLSDVGDTAGALATIQEAVEIRRRLAKANPACYESNLASSLNNLSSRLSNVGDTAGSLAASKEAVEINRRLVQANPARYEPDLARSLGRLGTTLRTLERYAEAVEAFREGANLIRPFAHQWPHNSLFAKLLEDLKSELERTQK